MIRQQREPFKISGTIIFIGEKEVIRRKNLPKLHKRIIGVETLDGQKLYLELRQKRLNLIESEKLEINTYVNVEYTFEGTERNNKRYNNLYVQDIKSV